MEKRRMEKLGVTNSLLGFGCMRFPTNDDGSINEIEAEKMIDEAIKNGVTYIDTAYPYHNGDSEPFVGKVLNKYDRNQYTLATKLPIWNVNSQDDVRKIFEEQLQRLDKDYVDFYLIHALDKDRWQKVLDYHVLDVCEKLRDEGKIKYIGFSFHDEYEVFENIITSYSWDFCQLQINYMDMNIQAGQRGIDLLTKLDIPLVVMEPIKGGSLASLPEDVASMFKEYDENQSLASWALRYVGTLPCVKVILSGMSTLDQVEDNLNTFNHYTNLNDDELKVIEKVADTLHKRTKNGCTGCSYCMPCPFGVDIPTNFKYWNNYFIYGEDKFKDRYAHMKDDAKASHCQKCGKCERMCPQHISIRDDLVKVNIDLSI